MREIKFRAWDKKKKGMYYHIEAINLKTLCVTLNNEDWYAIPDRFILMQYTGLKDKNGKEIYEGDIIQWFATQAIIEFRDGKFTPNIHDKNTVTNWKSCKVIGNIYKNPELLKGA